jgi:hypothetical protein
MNLAARADALDDFLTEIAAFGEVQCVGLVGLLRKIAVTNVNAEKWCAGEDAKLLDRVRRDGQDSRGFQCAADCRDGFGAGPKLIARDEWRVGRKNEDGLVAVRAPSHVERIGCRERERSKVVGGARSDE